MKAIHLNNPKAGESLKDLLSLRYAFNAKVSARARTAHLRESAVLFGDSNKAGKILANYLKARTQRLRITSMYTPDGALRTQDGEILDIFRRYYSTLYEAETNPAVEEMDSFFEGLHLPVIPDDDRVGLDMPFTLQEIKQAIQSLPNGKSPGPDGLTAEFFKAFQDILAPYLMDLFRDLIEVPLNHASFHIATTIVIPKPGKDPAYPQSYRPISLLNLENKIFAKILANRLAPLIPGLIGCDQVGFVKGRLATDHSRLLCNVLHLAPELDRPGAIVSIDAEKAFDRVEWRFLEYTLSRFGLGDGFLQMVRVLYTCPKTRIWANGKLSSTISLHRGTRQGCPLSPILFIMVLEPLLAKIRENNEITGLRKNSLHVKLTAYADDLLLYLTNPESSFGEVLRVVADYSVLSGYKVNWAKTEIMPLNPLCTHRMFEGPQTSWVPTGLQYLGMRFAPTLEETAAEAQKSILKIIRDTVSGWSPLHLSWWGRVESIRMVLTPKITYILSMLPVLLDPKAYKGFEREIFDFLWRSKPPRIARWKLMLPRDQGGIGFPRLRDYHRAFILRNLYHWFTEEPTSSTPNWVRWEALSTRGIPLADVAETTDQIPFITNRIIVETKMQYRDMLRNSQMGQCFKYLPLIWFNSDIKIGGKSIFWKTWALKGLSYVHQIMCFSGFLSFEELQAQYGLSGKENWRYIQLIAALTRTKHNCCVVMLDPAPPARSLFLNHTHLASALYKKILRPPVRRMIGVELAWNKDLMMDIPDDKWDIIWLATTKTLTSTSLTQSLLFVRHRTTWTPIRKWRAGFEPDGLCWRGCMVPGTLMHMIWECPTIRSFWTEVLNEINMILNIDLPHTPALALFSYAPETEMLDKHESRLLNTLLACAIQIIMKSLKDTKMVSYAWWWHTVSHWRQMEGALATTHPHRKCTRDMWLLMDQYLDVDLNVDRDVT